MYYCPHYALGLEHAKQGIALKEVFDTHDAATIGINQFGHQGCFCYLLGWHDGKDGIDFAKKNNKHDLACHCSGTR